MQVEDGYTLTAEAKVDGYTITDETDDDDGSQSMTLRDPDGCEIVCAQEDRGHWWLDGDVAGYAYRNIPLTSKESARELLMIIASLLPAPNDQRRNA